MSLSPRLKLAFLFSTVLAGVLLAFGTLAHVLAEQNARRELERTLTQQAQASISSRPAAQQGSVSLTSLDTSQSQDPEQGLVDDGLLNRVQYFEDICSLDNIARTFRLAIAHSDLLPISDVGLSAVQQGQPWTEITSINNTPVMVHSQPIMNNERVIGVAQAGKSYVPEQQALAMMSNVLLAGGGAATLLVFGLMWGVSGLVLAPTFKQLRAAHTQAREVEHQLTAQREFVADVSHELRAPLTTVRGNLGLLQRAPLTDDDRKAVLHDAVDDVERMSRMVNELLLLSCTGLQRALCMQPVALTPLAQALCRKTAALVRGRAMVSDLAPNIHVWSDPDAIQQILLILLDNAIKFTPTGGRITLSLHADATHAHLAVTDTGVGIAPDALPHIFDRFYRAADAGVTRQRSGHGLGLAIAKSLIDAQGGTIHVESTLGQGSAFMVMLPLARDH